MPNRRALLAISGLLIALFIAAPATAFGRDLSADPSHVGPARLQKAQPVGYDISYPQCGKPYPPNPAFGIVGVNRGIVFSANPCLGTGAGPSQLAWAGKRAELYANTGNPGPLLSSRWPTGQVSPKRCSAQDPDTAKCAYDYGWNAAADSYATAVKAYIALGWAAPGSTRTPVDNHWWLDVETANSWRSNVTLNIAALQRRRRLPGIGGRGLGRLLLGAIHVGRHHRRHIGLCRPSHLGGRCKHAEGRSGPMHRHGFTGGGVALAQYLYNGFDANYRC